jgi:aryl-alcohol dehydrogenase-like predicted oxidoreductase
MLREQTMTEQHGWLGDHKVRRIGYGAMQLAEGTPPPRDDAIAVLRRAVELGVDHIDTAEFYGDGLANDLISSARGSRPTCAGSASSGWPP